VAQAKPKTRKQLSDRALVERVQSVLIDAANGRRSIADDRQYAELRKEFSRRRLDRPPLVATHPTVDSFMGLMGGIENRAVREERIREEFAPLLQSILYPHQEDVASADWTGQPDRVARLKVVRELLPVAQSTVEAMIATLSEPGPNGGPLLDEREEAIKHLRELHGTLGRLLSEIDGGRFEDDLAQGLAADAYRLAKTVRDNLRDDPLPCAVAGLVLGICTIAGHPTAGAFLSDATYQLTRKKRA